MGHFGDTAIMIANMNNDTRGWVMCVTSGVGEYRGQNPSRHSTDHLEQHAC